MNQSNISSQLGKLCCYITLSTSAIIIFLLIFFNINFYAFIILFILQLGFIALQICFFKHSLNLLSLEIISLELKCLKRYYHLLKQQEKLNELKKRKRRKK